MTRLQVFALVGLGIFMAFKTYAQTQPGPMIQDTSKRKAAFAIFDNMFYAGKPNTAPDGLVACNILYENKIWPNKDFGVLPSYSAFEALVRAHIANPGPLVIDIEALPLNGPHETARKNMKILATLADWAHQAAPRKVIGYYGTNTLSRVPSSNLDLARDLARHVDAFFPSMYTFDDDRNAWEKKAQQSAAEAHELDPRKPVYFYLWPQYHDHTPKEFQYIDAAYWTFQLQTAYHQSNGIVLWSPDKFEWNDSSGWWTATLRFIHELRSTHGNLSSDESGSIPSPAAHSIIDARPKSMFHGRVE